MKNYKKTILLIFIFQLFVGAIFSQQIDSLKRDNNNSPVTRSGWESNKPKGANSIEIARDNAMNNLKLEDLLNEVFLKSKPESTSGVKIITVNTKDVILGGFNNVNGNWLKTGSNAHERGLAYFKTPDKVYYDKESTAKDNTKFPIKEGIVFGTTMMGRAEGHNVRWDNNDGFGAYTFNGVNYPTALFDPTAVNDQLFWLFGKMNSSATKSNIHNNAVLSFDFIAPSNKVSFNYIFASEEYIRYVGYDFNDVFGFIVEEYDASNNLINPRNIALIDPSNTAESSYKDNSVSINNVNDGINSDKFIRLPYTIGEVSPGNDSPIEFNGRTVLLTASAKVTPCKKYRMTLAVGNVNSRAFPSGVFLEAGSFDLGNILSHTIILEDGSVVATKNVYVDHTTALTVDLGDIVDVNEGEKSNLRFDFDNNGSVFRYTGASDGIIPNSITIPKGQQKAEYEILATHNALGKTHSVVSNPICFLVESGKATLNVLEPGKLKFDVRATPICNVGETSTVSIDVSGGVGFYQYRYKKRTDTSFSSWTDNNQFSSLNPGDYDIEVKDLAYTNIPSGKTNIYSTQITIADVGKLGLISERELFEPSGIFSVEAIMPAGVNPSIEWKLVSVVGGNLSDVTIVNINSPIATFQFGNNVKEAVVYAVGKGDHCTVESETITLRKGRCLDLTDLPNTHKTILRSAFGTTDFNLNKYLDVTKFTDLEVKWETNACPVDNVSINQTTGLLTPTDLTENGTYIFRYMVNDPCSGLIVRNFYLSIRD